MDGPSGVLPIVFDPKRYAVRQTGGQGWQAVLMFYFRAGFANKRLKT